MRRNVAVSMPRMTVYSMPVCPTIASSGIPMKIYVMVMSIPRGIIVTMMTIRLLGNVLQHGTMMYLISSMPMMILPVMRSSVMCVIMGMMVTTGMMMVRVLVMRSWSMSSVWMTFVYWVVRVGRWTVVVASPYIIPVKI